jgi:hypothetical protein
VTRVELLDFMRQYRVAVQVSVSVSGAPQAAIVGVAVGDDFEVVFDTLQSSRKAQNLRRDPRIALVLGGWGVGEERSVQYEGVAEEPEGTELERVRELYFQVYPDGREQLVNSSGLIHVRARPTWLRYSDFSVSPQRILEYSATELAALH